MQNITSQMNYLHQLISDVSKPEMTIYPLSMQPEKLKLYLDRLESVMSTMRNQNSGADTHSVGNIRNTASMLIDQLKTDPDCIEEDLVENMVKRVEVDLVKFYREKYWPHQPQR